MKIFKRLIALIMVVILMAGCTFRTNAGLKITENGKMSLVMIMALDNDFIDTYLTIKDDPDLQAKMNDENFDPSTIEVKAHTDAERWAFIENDEEGGSLFSSIGEDMEGFTKTKYDENGFKGYILSKEVGSLDDVTKESATARVNVTDALDDEETIKGQVLFTKSGDVYKSNMKLVAPSEDPFGGEDMSKLEELGAVMDISFIVTLPTKAISNNADSTEDGGKTLKWDLMKSKDLEFEFKLTEEKETTAATDEKESKKDKDDEKESTSSSSDSNLLLYAGIGVGALVLLIIIIVIIVSASKKKKAVAQPVQPAVMAPTYGPTVQPLDPVQPAQPVEPPVQPVQPVQPVEPPVQPVQPVQPVEQPVEPQDPNNTNQQM